MIQETDREGLERPAHTAMLEALLAGEGLGRVAAIASDLCGAEVEILIPRPGSDGADGDAAERFVAALVAGAEPQPPAELSAVVPIASGGELQGAVVMRGSGGEGAEDHLRSAAVAALTGVAMLNAREAAGREHTSLLRDLVAGLPVPPGEIVRRAERAGCDLGSGFSALCIRPAVPTASVVALIAAEAPSSLAEEIEGRIYALVPGPAEAASRLLGRLGNRVVSGRSSSYRRTADAGSALEEARVLVDMVDGERRRDTERPTWDTLRLLFRSYVADPAHVDEMSERVAGPLIAHDDEHGSELQLTFWAYLESNCNMNETAKETFTHRHTVANRLTRIEELTGLDPNRAYDRELLGTALKARYVVNLARPR